MNDDRELLEALKEMHRKIKGSADEGAVESAKREFKKLL